MDNVEGAIAAIAALFSGWSAWSSSKAAKAANRNSKIANRTAESARQTAESVAQIERDRWHTELTPQVSFKLTTERTYPELLVRYNGPSSLGRLDGLELRVRDDRDRSNDPLFAGSLTAEERAATIWGPLRFRRGANDVDESGRTVAPISLPPGEEFRLGLDASDPHDHYGGGRPQWASDYRNEPFRLWVTCHVEGHKPWALTADLPQHDGNATGTGWTRAT
ncbi:hypothetical protein ACFCWY_09185 [Streptomyces sp. NPDC056362]|uniref:hypothetical protein n=1 Tax=unclassified Streptomyces TaxID=2593676 RepID=UPI0035E29BBA